MTVLLTSSTALPRSSSRLHSPKLLTLGNPIILPPFDGASFYLPEHITDSSLVSQDRVKEYLRKHSYYYPSMNYDERELRDFFNSQRVKENHEWVNVYTIPNVFTVKTRKFSTLVNFNSSGLRDNPQQPAFIVFQENLEIMETIDYSFMLFFEPSLPMKPAYDGFKYVATHDKISLFVKAQIIQQ